MIDPELRKMVEESLDLSRENNKLLHKLHNNVIWSRVFRVLYWVVIITVTMGAYYFIQPMIDSFQGLLGGMENIQKAGGTIPNIGEFLKGI